MHAGTFNRLIAKLCVLAGQLPDRRTGKNARFTMAEIALSAFSVFFKKAGDGTP